MQCDAFPGNNVISPIILPLLRGSLHENDSDFLLAEGFEVMSITWTHGHRY